MGQFDIQCPGCPKRLRMSDQHRGRTVRCPACGTTFRLAVRSADDPVAPERRMPDEPPAPEPQRRRRTKPEPKRRRRAVREPDPWETAFDDPWSSDGEAIEFADDPNSADPFSAGSSASRARSRKKHSALPGQILKVLMFLLLILAGVGTVGGIGYLVVTRIPGIPGITNVVDLSYLPENTEGFIYIRPSQILNSAVIQALLAKYPKIRDSMNNAAGQVNLSLSDVESVTIGLLPNDDDSQEIPGVAAMMPWANSGKSTTVLAVVRLSKSIEPAALKMSSSTQHNGHTLYSSGRQSAWMPSSSTIIIGTESELKAAIDRGGQQFRFSQFDFAESGSVILAGVGRPSARTTSPGLPQGLGNISQLGTSITSNTVAGSLSLNFSSRLDLAAKLVCSDSDQSAKVLDEMNSAIAEGRQQLQTSGNNPMLQPLIGSIRSVMDSISAKRSGDTITVRATVERSVIDNIPAIPGY